MPPTPYAIFGGRGGGDVVADYLSCSPGTSQVLGFLNDDAPKAGTLCGRPVLGGFDDWHALSDAVKFLAPLHKAKEGQARRAVVEALGIPDLRWGQAIHPAAVISKDASLGSGTCIGPFSDIGPGAALGRHVALRAGVSISHDVSLGDFSFFGARAVALGYVQVGQGAHIGPGAILRDGIRVGRYAVVGLGSAVVSDVDDFAIVAGNPARVIGSIEPA